MIVLHLHREQLALPLDPLAAEIEFEVLIAEMDREALGAQADVEMLVARFHYAVAPDAQLGAQGALCPGRTWPGRVPFCMLSLALFGGTSRSAFTPSRHQGGT